MKIAIAAEIAPAKTFIPILEKLDAEVIGLTHGDGASELLEEFCSSIYSIGQGRGKEAQKRSNFKIAWLVLKDIFKAVGSLRGHDIDLLLTCGNAGDVRKGIAAAKILGIPNLHIEQDIYNPIEMIAYSNLVTVPSKQYKNLVEERYGLVNVRVIGGYPQASYIKKTALHNVEQIKNMYNADDFLLMVLGGDVKSEDLPEIIKTLENLHENILIAPYRFDKDHVLNLVKSPQLKVLDGFVDLLPIMNASSGMIYGAGMGLTIEAGAMEIPSIKLAGFHSQHASMDLAYKLGIPVVVVEDIPDALENLKKPRGQWLIDNGEKAVSNVVELINNFDNEKSRSSGFSSMRKIWKERSKFR
ncbi:MAG: hypothetical protein CIT01_05635 [Methanobacterium sp. BRmetb2]|nr:MAG: hypothetical protein CIT01_05635 [Methanobacterium sp. BRmetb2]